ncbi:DUF6119 family protein, partial [Peribacillus frigoritolerans]|uniref:DUF6119 family protein n=1 Tax=Peribacillus frigoritolerans TaxID=450367 RepID=UPI001F502F35
HCPQQHGYRIFAIAFGNAYQLLDPNYIVQDFAIKVSKSLIKPEEVSSVDSTVIDRKIYNTRKQAISKLLPDKITTSGEYSIIKNFHGKSYNLLPETGKKFILGGESGLSLTGKFNLTKDLGGILSKLGDIYVCDTEHQQLFKIPDNLKPVPSKKLKEELDTYLGLKFLTILNSPSIDKRNLKGIKIQPQKIFDLEDFNGFFITGLGYKKTRVAGDFEIDEVNYFERLKIKIKPSSKTGAEIIKKMQTDEIQMKFIDNITSQKICTVYQALSLEITYKTYKFILVSGKWYKIDKEFYSQIKREINSIPRNPNPETIEYITFEEAKYTDSSGKKREGLYNEGLAEYNKVLMLDRTKYSPGADALRKLQFKVTSNIEISDIFVYNSSIIQFIHVKRHAGGASGTSHLLAQAIVSAKTFNEDKENVNKFIQNEIDKHNKSNGSYCLLKYEDASQKKQIVLAIIDNTAFAKKSKVPKKNSELFSVLEMLSVIENINTLKNMGYECYLTFIPSDEK